MSESLQPKVDRMVSLYLYGNAYIKSAPKLWSESQTQFKTLYVPRPLANF